MFLQITGHPHHDLDIPGRKFSFGTVEAAQARGDFEVLAERGRRALRVHLTGEGMSGGLQAVEAALAEALGQR